MVGSDTADTASASTADQELSTALDIDPIRASSDDVVASVAEVDAAIRAQLEAIAAAETAKESAEATLAAAEDELAEAEATVDEVEEAATEAAADGSPGATAIRNATGVLRPRPQVAAGEAPADGLAAPAPVVEARAARNAVGRQVDEAEAAVDQASSDAEAAAETLDDLRGQEADLVAGIEERMEANLAEAEDVAADDPKAADEIEATERAISASLTEIAEERRDSAAPSPVELPEEEAPPAKPEPAPAPPPPPPPPPLPDPTGAVSGSVANVACPAGGYFVVDSSLAAGAQALVNDAHNAGVDLCAKSAFRSYNEQVELRRANCGPSEFDIHQASPSSCSPPTARPGTSNHEGGQAIDFSCADGQPMTHASPCFQWLAAHAGNYGLFNLPSEPWHWSVTGR
ncbi:MAG: M15 family metallopeptidase [Acidimicrobiales bacterium]|nr:M15 family metallopeptidase [Acidimicrobiales bacterium]